MIESAETYFFELLVYIMQILIILIPALLCIGNITPLVYILVQRKESKFIKYFDLFGIITSSVLAYMYLSQSYIVYKDWNVQIYDHQKHAFISTKHMLTIGVIFVIFSVMYLVLSFVPHKKISPLIAAIALATQYIAIAFWITFAIQMWDLFFIVLYAINMAIIHLKLIINFSLAQYGAIKRGEVMYKINKLETLLSRALSLPIFSFALIFPVLGVIILVLILFGQQPDSIIKAFTETADWNLSQKIPPESIPYDFHYLCTVACNGHKKIVKPIRNGKRHGYNIVVNRQICIANAFEQIIMEKTPRFHTFVRRIYDNYGYPIAKHIKTKRACDIVYILMKPLEWVFLIVIYLCDTKPENRIALQYPHEKIPDNIKNL